MDSSQLKKSKSWGPFWSYELNSTANQLPCMPIIHMCACLFQAWKFICNYRVIHHYVQIINLVLWLVGQLQLHGGNIKLIGHMTSSISCKDSREKDSNRPWMMSLRSLMASRRILKRIFLASSDIKLTTRWGPIFAFSLLKLSIHESHEGRKHHICHLLLPFIQKILQKLATLHMILRIIRCITELCDLI